MYLTAAPHIPYAVKYIRPQKSKLEELRARWDDTSFTQIHLSKGGLMYLTAAHYIPYAVKYIRPQKELRAWWDDTSFTQIHLNPLDQKMIQNSFDKIKVIMQRDYNFFQRRKW